MYYTHHLASRLSVCHEMASGCLCYMCFGMQSRLGDAKILKTCFFFFFNLQSCLGSTGAFPGRVCSVFSSFCASGNPMTDSTLMWLSLCNATDSQDCRGTRRQPCTFAWNCTSHGRKGEETSFRGFARLQSLTLI